jgi:organic radical activating enzyme
MKRIHLVHARRLCLLESKPIHIQQQQQENIFYLVILTGGDPAIWKQQFIQTKIEEHEEKETEEPN